MLARDLRLVEGFWVYPQTDLMTFFRSVATDLRSDTPIYLVGFTATPARDTIGAAALYAGRIAWFDHHDWPPEDLESLRLAIGKENVHVQPGAGSSLPLVLDVRSRRSRFSDKLVELVTARFSLHDHERWGRVWWQRLGELAAQPGGQARRGRAAAGRPPQRPRPRSHPRARHVAAARGRLRGRPRLPRGSLRRLHARRGAGAARPRSAPHGAHRARALRGAALGRPPEGSELVVLTGEEGLGRRSLDLGRLVSHLASVHEWIEALSDEDHVARMRVRELPSRPERLDDVIAEIAMGRSLFEA